MGNKSSVESLVTGFRHTSLFIMLFMVLISSISTIASATAPAVTITATNTPYVDSAQYEVYTAKVTGGTAPYTYGFTISDSITNAVLATDTFTTSSKTASFAWQITAFGNPVGTNITGNVIVTDSESTPKTASASSGEVYVDSLQFPPPVAASNTPTVYTGQYETFYMPSGVGFSYPFGGTWPLTITYNVINNANSDLVATQRVAQSLSHPTGGGTFTWGPIPTSDAYLTLDGNVVITDSSATPTTVNSVSTQVMILPPAVSISAPTNSVVDVGQYESFTATVLGGFSPYTFNFFAVNSASKSTITHNAMEVNGQTGTFTFQVNAQDLANSSEVANAVLTNQNPLILPSQYSTPFTVYSALVVGSPTPSSAVIDEGQPVTLTSNPSGGTGVYIVQWYSSPSTSCSSSSMPIGQGASITVSPQNPTTYYCYTVHDTATAPDTITSGTAVVTVQPQQPVMLPSNIDYYIPIIVQNYQPSTVLPKTPIAIGTSGINGTVTGINAALYQMYETCNLDNTEFFFANGTLISSWLEGNITNEMSANGQCTGADTPDALSSSNSILYWVEYQWSSSFLPAGSPSSPSVNVIYMGWTGNALTQGDNLFGSNTLYGSSTGEAPQLTCSNPSNTVSCATYGKYDNGNSVFTFETDFKGTSLPSWISTSVGSGSSVSVDNGIVLTVTPTSGNIIVYTNTGFKNLTSSDAYIDSISTLTLNTQQGLSTSPKVLYNGYLEDGYFVRYNLLNSQMYYTKTGLPVQVISDANGFTADPTTDTYMSMQWWSPANQLTYGNWFSNTYQRQLSSSSSSVSQSSTDYAWFGAQGAVSNGQVDTVQWFRGRLLPPNGILPATNLGTVDIYNVSLSAPSNAIADAGQLETFLANVNGGIQPFTFDLSVVGSATKSQVTNTLTSSGAFSQSDTFTFETGLNGQSNNQESANVAVTDQYPLTVNSSYAPFIVNPDPTATVLNPSSASSDQGQSVTYNVLISGGTGPFNLELLASNGTVVGTAYGVTDGFVTFAPIIPPLGTETYNVIGVDIGSTTPFTFNSISNTITAYSLPSVMVNQSSQTSDTGQPTTLTATVANPGSGGDTFQWYNDTTGTGVAISGATSPILTETYNAPGAFQYYVVMTDSNGGTARSSPDSTVTVTAPTLSPAPNYTITVQVNPSSFSGSGIACFGYVVPNSLQPTIVCAGSGSLGTFQGNNRDSASATVPANSQIDGICAQNSAGSFADWTGSGWNSSIYYGSTTECLAFPMSPTINVSGPITFDANYANVAPIMANLDYVGYFDYPYCSPSNSDPSPAYGNYSKERGTNLTLYSGPVPGCGIYAWDLINSTASPEVLLHGVLSGQSRITTLCQATSPATWCPNTENLALTGNESVVAIYLPLNTTITWNVVSNCTSGPSPSPAFGVYTVQTLSNLTWAASCQSQSPPETTVPSGDQTVNIEINPSAYSATGVSCFGYVPPGGNVSALSVVCAGTGSFGPYDGNGQASASATVPVGSEVFALCSENAHGFVNWTGSGWSSNPYYGSSTACPGAIQPNVTVSGPLTLVANLNSGASTTTSSVTTTIPQNYTLTLNINPANLSDVTEACVGITNPYPNETGSGIYDPDSGVPVSLCVGAPLLTNSKMPFSIVNGSLTGFDFINTETYTLPSVDSHSYSFPVGVDSYIFGVYAVSDTNSINWAYFTVDGNVIDKYTDSADLIIPRYSNGTAILIPGGQTFPSGFVGDLTGSNVTGAIVINKNTSITANWSPSCISPSVTISGPTTVNDGANVTYSAITSGTAPFTYQWVVDSITQGTNSSSFTRPYYNVSCHDGQVNATSPYGVAVKVSNACGSADSQIITVNTDPPAPSNATAYCENYDG